MLRKTFFISLIVTITLVSIVLFSLPTPPLEAIGSSEKVGETQSQQSLLISNVTIFNGKSFQGPLDLELQNGVIRNISTTIKRNGQRVLEGKGKVVIPGLIDAHTHSFGDALSSALNFGVTTQIDMFSSPELLSSTIKQRSDRTQNAKADLFSAGMLATVEGGHGTQFGIKVDTISSLNNNSNDIDQWLERRIQEGSDFIKIVYMPYSRYGKSLDRVTAAKIIARAHKKNLKVVAHISSLKAARELLEDDIDGFVHIFADEIADPQFVEQAKTKGIFIIPTLSIIASATQERFASILAADSLVAPFLSSYQKQQLNAKLSEQAIPGFDFDIAKQNTKLLYQAGVPILAGSDAPNPGTSYGVSLHQEIELLQQAGLSLVDSLRAATSNVANSFDIKGIGTITKGAKADFIILSTDTFEHSTSSRNIYQIYKNGELVTRTSAQATRQTSAIEGANLSQFDQGLVSTTGITWSKTDDSVTNGKSHSRIFIKDGILNVEATVDSGFIFPWAGANGFAPQARDISRFKRLQFNIRGSQGEYRAMMFAKSTTGAPPVQTFTVSDQWSQVRLDLDKFIGADTHNFIGVAVVAGPTAGTYKYQLDDVKLLP